ncbi:hypothetical protein TYRP_005354 [Tyrophagus putrescentiae]|nr:hypothetical protein TYRP_005354 [Tyrophagus putrescentiae]
MSRVNVVADHEGNSAKGKEAHRQRNQVEEPLRHLKTEDENVHHEEHRLLDAVLQNLRLRQEVVVLAGQRILRPRSAQPSSHHIEDGEKIGQSREEEQFEGVEEAVRFRGQILGQLDAEVGVELDVEGDGDGEQEEGGAHADGQCVAGVVDHPSKGVEEGDQRQEQVKEVITTTTTTTTLVHRKDKHIEAEEGQLLDAVEENPILQLVDGHLVRAERISSQRIEGPRQHDDHVRAEEDEDDAGEGEDERRDVEDVVPGGQLGVHRDGRRELQVRGRGTVAPSTDAPAPPPVCNCEESS